MGRKNNEKTVEKKAVLIEKKVDKKPTVEELQEIRNQITQLDTDKANKDILIKNAKELHRHIDEARATLSQVNHEIENGVAALKHVEDEIKSQNYVLGRQKEKFDKENAERIRLLDAKQVDVDAADATYKRLLVEVSDQKKTLQNGLKDIADERRAHQIELNRLNRHVHDIETEASKQKADIEEREKALFDAKLAFEEEKAALQPELTRISEIKNENTLLWQNIEEAKADIARQRSLMDSYKAKLDAEAEQKNAALERQIQVVKNEDGKLRKWEQDLKDFELELKAREAEAQKAMKRYQLNKVVEGAEK